MLADRIRMGNWKRGGTQIGDLAIGSRVNFGKYDGKPITWIIADKNHGGYPNNSVTLVASTNVTFKAFDAKEPDNTDFGRKNYGNNRYLHSNIRQWLNKAGMNWYTPQHSADAPPNSSGVSTNHYDAEAGFLSGFTLNELDAILDTNLTVAKNTFTDGGGSETVIDKVFLLSNTEVGYTNENSIVEGVRIPIFTDGASRKTGITTGWRLRTPDTLSSYRIKGIDIITGNIINYEANNGTFGIRPAMNIKSSYLLSIDLERFSPLDIPNLAIWLDAEKLKSNYINGASISIWEDSSSNGNSPTQSTVANKPVLYHQEFNGKACVRFNQSKSMVKGLNINLANVSVFAVFNARQFDSIFFEIGTGSVNSGVSMLTWENLFYSRVISKDVTNTLNYPYKKLRTLTLGEGYHKAYENGLLIGQIASLDIASNLSTFTLGASNNYTYYSDVDIAEIIVYNRLLTDTERQQVEQYLIDKWGL